MIVAVAVAVASKVTVAGTIVASGADISVDAGLKLSGDAVVHPDNKTQITIMRDSLIVLKFRCKLSRLMVIFL
jgi:predicted acyltransferase (DUF342 family)